MAEGYDASWSKPSPSTIKTAGRSFIGLYLDDPGGKGVTRAQLQSYLNAGVQVYLIKEGSGQETKSGAPAGSRDGNLARSALSALGLPATTDVFYAVDYDVTTQLGLIDAYLNAATAAQGHQASVYGEFDVIEHCVGGTARYGFQTYAWSHGKVSGKTSIYQYLNGQTVGGAQVDLNRNLTAAFGAINGATLAPSSGLSGNTGGYNATGVPTEVIQAALIRAGYNLGPTGADGIYGALTTAAVHQLEIDRHLSVDVGIAGPQVLAALGIVSGGPAPVVPVVAKVAPRTAPAYPLPRGYYFGPKSGPVQSVSGYYNHSADLKVWQSQMQARGWNINPDGLYGPQTAGVAEAFQKQKGLEVDSLIGPETWAAAWTETITA